MQTTTVIPTKNRMWPWREVSPYGNRLSAHARNANPSVPPSTTVARRVRAAAFGSTGRSRRPRQHDQARNAQSPNQQAGKPDGQAQGRDTQMSKRQRNRIHAQDKIEQRD